MIEAASGDTFEAVCTGFQSGLTGTIGVRILDNNGATTTARVTAGIAEYPTSSGIYTVTLTAPATVGQYSIMWDTGTVSPFTVATEDLIVSGDATPFTGGTSNIYVTRAELKGSLNIGSSYANDDIDVAISAASRAIDGYTGDRFYPSASPETRYYTGRPAETSVRIDSVNDVDTVTVDTGGTYTYSTTWTDGTDFVLTPLNAAADGAPYTSIELVPQAGQVFPAHPKSIKVVGTFGWADTPAQVVQACTILAGRLLKRARETPYGIVVVSGDAVAAARLGHIDPDVAFLLDNLNGSVPLLMI